MLGFLKGKWAACLSAGLCIVSSLLFSNCDMMGGSIKEFIVHNTGDASVKAGTFDITSTTELSKTNEIWMHYPQDDGIFYIQFKVSIENPHNYDLAFTPAITEFIGPDGVKINAPDRELRPIYVYERNGNTIGVRIDRVERGDSFKVRIDIATSDGARVFPSFSDIPQIVFDKRLYPAVNLEVLTDTTVSPNQLYAKWAIPTDDEHKYINKITLTFTSASNSRIFRGPWTYMKDPASGIWRIAVGDGLAWQYYSELAVEPDGALRLNFPLNVLASEVSEFTDDYIYTVVLEDKNGVVSTARRGGVDERYTLESLQIREHYIKSVNGDGSPVYDYRPYTGFDYAKGGDYSLAYALKVPYEVIGLEFSAAKRPEDASYQQVFFDPVIQDAGVAERGLPNIGSNVVRMIVRWTDPSGLQTDEQIMFNIWRGRPNRDSTLKDLSVAPAGGGADIQLTPAFQRPDDNHFRQGEIRTHYTVNVAPTVDSVTVTANYLDVSRVYNHLGETTLGIPIEKEDWFDMIRDPHYRGAFNNWGNRDGPFPSDPREDDWFYSMFNYNIWRYENNAWVDTNFVNTDDYLFPDYAHITEDNGLKIVSGHWTYSGLKHGENHFEINVLPQSASSQDPPRLYTITVIRPDPVDNPNAKLSGISINGGVPLSPVFSQNTLSYTAHVPYLAASAGSVALVATPVGNARINEIAATSSAPDYTPGNPGQAVSTDIAVAPGSTNLVTIKVGYGDSGLTPRNYLVRVNGNLPPPSGVALTAKSRRLDVKWEPVSGATAYEVYYKPGGGDFNGAIRWGGDFTGLETSIEGLGNGTAYTVWVRGKKTVNGVEIVGDLIAATATPDDGHFNVGISFGALPGDSTSFLNNPVPISWRDKGIATINAPADSGPCEWFIDSQRVVGADATEYSLTVRARNLSIATHTVTAKFWYEHAGFSFWCSKSVKLKVAP